MTVLLPPSLYEIFTIEPVSDMTPATSLSVLNSYDSDNDFIPNDIEDLIGTDKFNSDENENGTIDGKELDGSFGDPFFKYQWHIENKGLAMNQSGASPINGNDLDLFDVYHKYMGYNKGNPIRVHIVDTGLDMNHEDLTDNFDLVNSYKVDFDAGRMTKGRDPSSVTKETHGTMVSGIVGARGFNGLGVRGVAPFVKLSATNFIQDGSSYPGFLDKVWRNGDIDIFNNSWGVDSVRKVTLYEEYMELGVRDGRDGKGAIYVFSAGNSRQRGGNTNLDYARGNRFVVPVAALNSQNKHSSYSTPSSNAMVSGYGGEYFNTAPTIGTTTISGEGNVSLTWVDDVSLNYSNAMNGTSSAAPTVSGSLALVLEACPDLGWRDVKYLIAKTATKIDTGNSSWTTNDAGFNFSEDYGFGLINTKGMIIECRDNNYINLPAEVSGIKISNINETIDTKDFSSVFKEFTINVTNDMTLEWVGVTIDSNITFPLVLDIHLVSPSGTEIDLFNIYVDDGSKIKGDPSPWLDGGHRFGVNGLMGENSKGDWRVKIRDNIAKKRTGLLRSIKLEMHGH